MGDIVPDRTVGDILLARHGRRFRILAVDRDLGDALSADFDGIWTVEGLRGST